MRRRRIPGDMERKGLPATAAPVRSRAQQSKRGHPTPQSSNKKSPRKSAGQNLVPLRGVEPPTY